ncbi:MAG: ADP-glyceromanno-heptose 6-epimerase [Bacteroidia bacterium]
MIVVTGAAGFIGSCVAHSLYNKGYKDLLLVDDFSKTAKANNLIGFENINKIDREEFIEWIDSHYIEIEFIVHIGARTDTTEFDTQIFDHLNLNYTKSLWQKCVEYGFPIIYASSAATYGGGELGYNDTHEILNQLQPLNPYGESKNDFDKWALAQDKKPYYWIGLKFFNVYGPNEYHKGRMASVVYHTYNQIKIKGSMSLFKSHNADYKNGEQKRDFIYVKDVVDVIIWLLENRKPQNNGLYNLGTGKAQTFLDLATGVFKSLNLESKIEFIDTPEDIRDKYQYFTEANMQKLKNIGYDKPFTSLAQGVKDYVQNYLDKDYLPF